VHEGEPVALQPLHDEALASEQAHADLLLERDADRDALGRAQERVLLAHELAALLLQVHREDPAGVGCGERHLLLAAALGREDGHEQALAGEDALARAEQRSHQALRLALAAAVAEDRLHLDAGGHVHERARLRHDALARVELHLDELQVLALDAVVDLVGARQARSARTARDRRGGQGRQVRLELVHLAERGPVRHPGGEHERAGFGAAALDRVHHVGFADRPDLLAADGHEPLRCVSHVACFSLPRGARRHSAVSAPGGVESIRLAASASSRATVAASRPSLFASWAR
jgi:hypothetical protein